LQKCLRAANIVDNGIIADSKRITTVKTRIIARHQQVVRVDQERREALHAETQEKLLRLLFTALKKLDAVVLSDYDKGLITDDFADRVLSAAHQLKVPVFVKPKTSRLYAYRGARAIVCNMMEAGFFVTHSTSDENSLENTGWALLARFGCGSLVITRGPKGMNIFEEGSQRSTHIPATGFEVTYARVGQPGIEQLAGRSLTLPVQGTPFSAFLHWRLQAGRRSPMLPCSPTQRPASWSANLARQASARRSSFMRWTTFADNQGASISLKERCQGTGKLNDLSEARTQTSTTLVLRLFSVSEASGIGEKGLTSTEMATAFEPLGALARIIL
jgi:hypothetical protein